VVYYVKHWNGVLAGISRFKSLKGLSIVLNF
jgi:hypothetical protein